MKKISEVCETCGFLLPLQKHHLIPQHVSRSTKYNKALKKDETNFLWICNECHRQIHALYSDQELRDLYSTKELLMAAPEFAKFIVWRKKHPEFKGSSKMSNRRK
jgi:hypothetical protein